MTEIQHFDDKISEITSQRNAIKIKNNFLRLSEDGIYSVQKMWKSKQNISTKNSSVPAAIFNEHGQVITTKAGILTLYEQEYKKRLAKDPPHAGCEELQLLKENLFRLRIELASKNKSLDWTIQM